MKKNCSSIKSAVYALIAAVIFTGCSNLKAKELQYKDSFPKSISLYSYMDKRLNISDIKNKYKMVFYLDSSSPDCLQRLAVINKMMKIYDYKNISYVLLWEDEIPVDSIKKNHIDLNINYTLKGRTTLSKSRPDGFLLDENNKVMRVTGYDYIDVIKDIIDLEGTKDILTRVNEEIFNNASGRDKKSIDREKPTLLMFLTSNCKLCRETEAKINLYSPMLQKKMNLITVRPDFDARQGFDVNYVTDYSLVYYNAYDKLYNAKQFPFFAVLDKDNKVQKYFSDVDEMINYVRNLKLAKE